MEFKINENLFFYYILKVKNWVIYGILYYVYVFNIFCVCRVLERV